jgi:hypothetical protein
MVVIDNKLASRISALSQKNKKTFNQQLELMIETFEIMDIHKLYFLPSPTGGHSVPVVEVYGAVIQGGLSDA